MRKLDALRGRETAAKIAHDRQHPVHVANGEERAYREAHSFMSFTKGLPHDAGNGLVKNKWDPVRLRTAIDSGFSRDFDLNVPLGDRNPVSTGPLQWQFHDTNDLPNGRINLGGLPDDAQHRRWEAPTAGFVYDLQGPDAQAVTMPPAPTLVTHNQPHPYHGMSTSAHGLMANPELVAEMAEVYWLALLRDKHLAAFDEESSILPGASAELVNDAASVQKAVDHLGDLPFYQMARDKHPRRRLTAHDDSGLTRQNVFRGHTPGERKGPYLSQFMLMGTKHLGDNSGRITKNGYLQYGSITVDMRVRTAEPERDYMTHWNEWLDVQNGANVGGAQAYVDHGSTDPLPYRFITTPRDLATYVHFDALYEAYLNACIWLLNKGAPFDPNFRHLLSNTRHTTGFALFGGPHILSLMTEVATRSLKAVRFQKFNNHLRMRPEALAGLLATQAHINQLKEDAAALTGQAQIDAIAAAEAIWPDSTVASHVELLYDELNQPIVPMDPMNTDSLLDKVAARNVTQNADHATYLGTQTAGEIAAANDLPLLPMAFPEGSPMHPSYGAGHATVAGACVTILKAFFDEDACLVRRNGDVTAVSPADIEPGDLKVAFVPNDDGSDLTDQVDAFGDFLRVGDELNKLAANISIARDMAGVHYYSDYIDSLRMGEEIALGVLQEQSIMYPKDPFQVSLTSFDGKRVIIGDGEIQCLDAEPHHQDSYGKASEALIAAITSNPDLLDKIAKRRDRDAGPAEVSKVA